MASHDKKVGTNKYVREWLQLAMAHRNLTQLQLAARAHMSKTYVCDLVSGKRNLNPRVTEKLAKGLDLTEEERLALHVLGAKAKGWEIPRTP